MLVSPRRSVIGRVLHKLFEITEESKVACMLVNQVGVWEDESQILWKTLKFPKIVISAKEEEQNVCFTVEFKKKVVKQYTQELELKLGERYTILIYLLR